MATLSEAPHKSASCVLAERYLILTLNLAELLAAGQIDDLTTLISEREKALTELQVSKMEADALPILQKAIQADEVLNIRFQEHYQKLKDGLLQHFKEKRGAVAYQRVG